MPLIADLVPLDQLQRDRSCDRKHCVESGDLVARLAILTACVFSAKARPSTSAAFDTAATPRGPSARLEAAR